MLHIIISITTYCNEIFQVRINIYLILLLKFKPLKIYVNLGQSKSNNTIWYVKMHASNYLLAKHLSIFTFT